jgi:hypothetical protein
MLQRTHANETRDSADEAVGLVRSAVALTDATTPTYAAYQVVLGNALLIRHAHSDSPVDLDAAVTAYQRATAVESGEPDMRIAAAREWAIVEAQRGHWASAADGYAAATGILDVAVWPGLHRADRERKILKVARGLGTDGAASALSAHQAGAAVGLAEAGRAVIWGQVLDARSDLTRLSALDPQLAARLDAVRTATVALDAGMYV